MIDLFLIFLIINYTLTTATNSRSLQPQFNKKFPYEQNKTQVILKQLF